MTKQITWPVLSAVILTIALWAGFTLMRHPVRPAAPCANADSTQYTDHATYCGASYLIHRDPYCLLDPTCASPLLESPAKWATAWNRPLPSWQGAAWIPDYRGPANVVRMFSIFNYLVFVLCCALLLWAVLRLPAKIGIAFAAGLVTWFGLEALRWMYTFWNVGDWYGSASTYSVVDWATYAFLALIVVPIVIAVKQIRKGLAQKSATTRPTKRS